MSSPYRPGEPDPQDPQHSDPQHADFEHATPEETSEQRDAPGAGAGAQDDSGVSVPPPPGQYGPGPGIPPAYGDPAHGLPAYGAPAYGPPAYGAPAYGPPAYGPPGYAPPGYPGYGGYGYPGQKPPGNTTGMVAMILGIVSIALLVSTFFLAPFAAVPAIILGVMGRRKVRRGEADNGGQALAGIICGSIIMVLTALVVAFFVIIFSDWDDDPEYPPYQETSATEEVVYEVLGTSGLTADVGYATDDDLGAAQELGVVLPWSTALTMDSTYFNEYEIYVQAQGSGGVTCRIMVDGVVLSVETAEGENATVTCLATN